MRSTKVIILTTDRPTTDDRPLISKISNGHISATGRPIHSMFGSGVGFSGTADLMALFPVRKIVTLDLSATVFEILTLKARKSLNFLTPPFFEAPTRGTPQNLVMKFGVRKLESWGYQKVKKSRR